MNPALLLNPKAFAKEASKKNQKPKAANTPTQQITPTSPKTPTTPRSSKTTLSGVETSPSKTPSYNPATLLNPKAAAVRASTDPVPKNIQQNAAAQEAAESRGESNYGSLIEQMHGVTRREAAPTKRKTIESENGDDVSVEDDAQRKRAKFTGGGKGGIIGQSVKDIRQQAQDERGVPTVDLTSNDDDELTITGTNKLGGDSNREVCIGTIAAKVMAYKVPQATSKALAAIKNIWPPSKVTIRRVPGQALQLDVLDRGDHVFGRIEYNTAMALAPVLNGTKIHKTRCNALLTDRAKKPGQHPGQNISEQMNIRINVFCGYQHAEGIRRALSQKNVHMTKPVTNTEGRDIVFPEPKIFAPNRFADPTIRNGQADSTSHYIRSEQEIKDDVQSIIDNLPDTKGLPKLLPQGGVVTTELLEHQQQALWFLKNKETPITEDATQDSSAKDILWKMKYRNDGSKQWYNVITGTEVKAIPQCFGGLFSDEMGLGKTLSILSLVADTLPQAVDFGKEKPSKNTLREHEFVEKNVMSTLVVCPKSVLTNWKEQIEAHLDKEKISYYIYHGPKREQDLKKLIKYGLIITSYTTIESEYRYRNGNGKYKAMNRLNFYRVVLDEAHTIRNTATAAFTACCNIASDRRWAVTGTPVQNKLDDLGALIKFIRISPFHQKSQWEQHFTAAWRAGNEQVLPNLKVLVSSLMLRRSKQRLGIPDPVLSTQVVKFTDQERGLYDAFAKDSYGKMDAMTDKATGRLHGRGTAHMLTFITRLRLICCHGRQLLSDEDMRILDGKSNETAIVVGDDEDVHKPALSDTQIYDMFSLMRDSNANTCAYCAKEVDVDADESRIEEVDGGDDNDSDVADSKDIIGYITPCYHIFCPDDMPKYLAANAPGNTSDGYTTCTMCQTYTRITPGAIHRSGVEAEEARRQEQRSSNGTSSRVKSSIYTGPHSKVVALLQHLGNNAIESLPLMAKGEPPIRSIVFSGWTQYLDLIGTALTDNNITFLRLDGKMHVSARTKVMEQFRTDPSVTVMLVSIRAGGQGLNLTAASKVYMMEPQFNPGVEMQAVDRVHRIGQTRDVEIVKFVMENSFEGKILALQEQKLRLAGEALGKGGKGTAKERLDGLRSLFR